jgi:CBS domain-containing protein
MATKKLDLRDRTVRTVMAVHVVAVNPRDPVSEALKLFVEHGVSALPVVDGQERCVGVLSANDLLELAEELGNELEALGTTEGLDHEMLLEKIEHTGFTDQTVQELMTPTAVEIGPDESVVAAARAMVDNRVHHLAVTKNGHRLVGIVSTMDVLKALAEGAG